MLFLLAAIGANVGTFGIANLGLASLAAGLFVDKWVAAKVRRAGVAERYAVDERESVVGPDLRHKAAHNDIAPRIVLIHHPGG
ncbi:MAG TPA: hypothetical protein VMP67_03960 [Candidatus Limnocylindria bacterium]|nr:hypothetical protein [Candidatus Limnocylindria bacterium]